MPRLQPLYSPMVAKTSPLLAARRLTKYPDPVLILKSCVTMRKLLREEPKNDHTMSWQLPFGAPTHLSRVICMRPCSPAPPTADGLQKLSCIANAAIKIGGTVCRDQQREAHATHQRRHKLSRIFPYFSKVAIIWSLQAANAVCLALSRDTVTSCPIST